MLKRVRKSNGVKVMLVVSMVGMGTVSYIPTVYAATEQKTVTTTSEEDLNTNSLSKLEIEGIQLDQVLSADKKEYTATVENDIQQITLHVASDNPESGITINGQSVTDGTAGPIALRTGENSFLITVADGSHSANTYNLTITRKQSNNNLLKNIKLSNGELLPQFASAMVDYNISVTNEVTSIKITPEAIEGTSSIQVNNQVFKNHAISVPLPVGKSTISILVTAENGDKKTYTLHVTRAAKQSNKPPVSPTKQTPNTNGKNKNTNHSMQPNQSGQTNNSTWLNKSSQKNSSTQKTGTTVQKTSLATLSSLTVSNGTWNKAFTSSAYTYHLAVSNDTSTVTINPSAKYSSSSITVEGNSSKTVKLTGNKTIISVVVTNGDERKTYVLVFKKKVQKSESTTESKETTDSTVSISTNALDTNKVNTSASVQKTAWTGSKNNSSPTTWGRIVAFFKKIF